MRARRRRGGHSRAVTLMNVQCRVGAQDLLLTTKCKACPLRPCTSTPLVPSFRKPHLAVPICGVGGLLLDVGLLVRDLLPDLGNAVARRAPAGFWVSRCRPGPDVAHSSTSGRLEIRIVMIRQFRWRAGQACQVCCASSSSRVSDALHDDQSSYLEQQKYYEASDVTLTCRLCHARRGRTLLRRRVYLHRSQVGYCLARLDL